MSKLYYVQLKGMKSNIGGNTAYGTAYVIADNPTEAYEKVFKYVRENSLGFYKDRELESITLIADSAEYSSCGIRLYL